jgi:hypothetical protein
MHTGQVAGGDSLEYFVAVARMSKRPDDIFNLTEYERVVALGKLFPYNAQLTIGDLR